MCKFWVEKVLRVLKVLGLCGVRVLLYSFFSSFVFMLEIFMGHMWSIRGVFMGYTYVSGMCRVCIGYVSGMYRNKQEKWGKYLHI